MEDPDVSRCRAAKESTWWPYARLLLLGLGIVAITTSGVLLKVSGYVRELETEDAVTRGIKGSVPYSRILDNPVPRAPRRHRHTTFNPQPHQSATKSFIPGGEPKAHA